MAASDIIQVADEEGGLFTLPAERQQALTSPFSAVNASAMFTTYYASKCQDLAKCFKQGGPKG